jgi:hypothetical protein
VLRFRLRTLFIVLAVAGVIAAIAGYRIRARNPYRDFLTGFNYNFGPRVADPSEVARRLRERSATLPRHKPTDDEILKLSEHVFYAGYQKLEQSQLVDRFFYRVQLADRSETRAGIWVYRKEDGEVGATVVVYGADDVPERNQERFDLFDGYQEMVETIDLELREASLTAK